jgi:cytochrome c peroxidase
MGRIPSPLLLLLLLALACALAAIVAHRQGSAAATAPAATVEEALVDLGRRLFYDRRLSGDGLGACAGCHRQELGFSDGRPLAVTAGGAALGRNTPGLFNVGELESFGWADPSVDTLAAQVARPLAAAHPPEMGAAGREAAILARLRADGGYRARFAAAFPGDADPLRWERVIDALAAFIASLAARDTPYDRFSRGDEAALTPAARRGMALFFAPGLACGRCHVDIAPPGAASRWGNLGYVANGAGRSADLGLAEARGRPDDAYRFRVPPLRNVAVTGPYMHDGSLQTLDAVVRFYESGGREGAGAEPARAAARHDLVAGFALSDAERRDLLAFLAALTDAGALNAPAYSDPFAIPAPAPDEP